MPNDPPGEGDDERVQINVTLKRRTIDKLRTIFPVALDDSERVRSAVHESIELDDADGYTIRRTTD